MAFSLDDFLNDDFGSAKKIEKKDAEVPSSPAESIPAAEPIELEPVELSGEFYAPLSAEEDERSWNEAQEYYAAKNANPEDDALEELRRKLLEPVVPTDQQDFNDIVAGLEFTEPEVIVVEKQVTKQRE